MDLKIFVATHKKVNLSLLNCYEMVQVGSDLNELLPYTKDNTGDNISNKNKNFCELTLLYWMWKNTKYDIEGLVHYRRFFYKHGKIINADQIEKYLNKYDAILPQKKIIHFSNVKKEYCKYHFEKDYDLCRKVLGQLYPEYVKAFDKVSNSKSFYTYNMIITKKEILDKYCDWLFSILFELEKKIDLSSYDNYNQRLYGFLSERLLNVWIIHNNITVLELPVYNSEKNFFIQKVKTRIHKLLKFL